MPRHPIVMTDTSQILHNISDRPSLMMSTWCWNLIGWQFARFFRVGVKPANISKGHLKLRCCHCATNDGLDKTTESGCNCTDAIKSYGSGSEIGAAFRHQQPMPGNVFEISLSKWIILCCNKSNMQVKWLWSEFRKKSKWQKIWREGVSANKRSEEESNVSVSYNSKNWS